MKLIIDIILILTISTQVFTAPLDLNNENVAPITKYNENIQKNNSLNIVKPGDTAKKNHQELIDSNQIDSQIRYRENIVDETAKDIDGIKNIILSDEIPELLLVNKEHPLKKECFVNHVVANKIPATRELAVNKQALEALEKLYSDCVSDGIKDLLLVSAYRDVAYQERLFEREMNLYLSTYSKEDAYNLASKAVAIPGTSEHHTGLAIDFLSSTQYTLDISFDKTPSGKWLMNNAYKYGFILRYPADKTMITGIMYEPWHYRYVGQVHAEYMTLHKLTLEEYHELIESEGILSYTDEENKSYEIYFINDLETFDFQTSNIDINNIVDVSNLDDKSYIITTCIE